jgi:hypothetical protein
MYDVAVFFIRGSNDLDNIVPVIFGVRRSFPGVPITCVFTELTVPLSNWQVIFLKTVGVRVMTLAQIAGYSKSAVELMLSPLDRPPTQIEKLRPKYWKAKSSRQTYAKKIAVLDLDYVIDQIVGRRENILLVFDSNRRELTFRLAEFVQSRKISVAGLAHGACLGGNFEGIDLEHIASDQAGTRYLPFQPMLVSNFFQRSAMLLGGQIKPEQIVVVGSARYSREWIEHRDRIIGDHRIESRSVDTLKIVLFASKPVENLASGKYQETLSAISSIRGVELIVKAHTRGPIYPSLQNQDWRTVGTEIDSAVLIDWADLVLFSHTSVILEAVIKDKPIGYLKELVIGEPMHERIEMSWQLSSIAELTNTIQALREDREARTYSLDQRRRFMNEFIYPVGEDVIDRAARTLMSI